MKLGSTLLGIAILECAVLGTAVSAQAAESILYRNDIFLGTDYLGQAVNGGGFTVTQTNGDLSTFTLSNYNIVVYANQNLGVPAGDMAALNAYIASGGRVIFDDWTGSNTFLGNQSFTGETNQTVLNLSMFNNGISNPLSVTNTGYTFTFSTSMNALAGGILGGTFGDGSGAIVVGNGGRTIVNGFLSDTVASEQLYANELDSLSGVPEPSAWALLLAGFFGLGALTRAGRRTAPRSA